jgi:hypothetical protein
VVTELLGSLLAAYDLGATADHLQKMYEDEAKSQKSIFREEGDREIVVDDGNWVQYLGNTSYVSCPLVCRNKVHSCVR